jgi:hypothetical protein
MEEDFVVENLRVVELPIEAKIGLEWATVPTAGLNGSSRRGGPGYPG